ncbi:MAG: TRAP transporter substrate-binding protein DctP [Brevinema sp.]
MIRFACLLILLLLQCTNPNSQKKSDHISLSFSHHYPENTIIHESILFLKKIVETKTDGKVKIYIFASSVRGKDKREIIKNIRKGEIDLGIENTGVLEEYSPEFRAFDMPFIFEDDDHFHKTMSSPVAKTVFKNLKTNNLIALGYLDRGFSSFYSKFLPIVKPTDIRNKKFAIRDHALIKKMIESLDGFPVIIPDDDVNTCIVKEKIRGAENTPLHFVEHNTKKLIKYFSLVRHVKSIDFIIINRNKWFSLSPEVQNMIEESIKEMEIYYHKAFYDKEQKALARNKELYFTIQDGINREAFRKALEPMYEDARKDMLLKNIINDIIELRDKK